MIANEDNSRQARQVDQAKRLTELQQQHHHQQHQQVVYQGASAFPQETYHQKAPQGAAPTTSQQYVSGDVSPSRIPNLSPTQPDKQFISKGPMLKRQVAFDSDFGINTTPPKIHKSMTPNQPLSQQTSIQHLACNRPSVSMFQSVSNPPSYQQHVHPHDQTQQYLRNCRNIGNQPKSTLSGHTTQSQTQPQSTIQQSASENFHHQTIQNQKTFSFFPCHTSPVSRIQTDSPMTYSQGYDTNISTSTSGNVQNTFSSNPRHIHLPHNLNNSPFTGQSSNQICNDLSTPSTSSRARSHSNPVEMMKIQHSQNQILPKPMSPTTEGGRCVDEIVSSLHARDTKRLHINNRKSQSFPVSTLPTYLPELPTSTTSGHLGLFSGRQIPMIPSTSHIPTTVDSDDIYSSSSDDADVANIPASLFQSSNFLPVPKRTLSDPAINISSHRIPVAMSTDSELSLIQEICDSHSQTYSNSFLSDPHKTLDTLTTVHCLSSTRTLNTPSPSPFSVVPRCNESPFSTSSPAPSTSSNMGYSNITPSSSNAPSPAHLPCLGSLLDEYVMDTTNKGSAFLPPSCMAPPAVSTTMAVSATPGTPMASSSNISESDLFSFIADLEKSEFESKENSTQLTSMPVTPFDTFRNVPNFLDEILGEPDDKKD